jgi:iron complex outermembrane recepter protein
MTLKTTKLRDAISFALAVGTTALAGTGVAYAQEQESQEELDTVVVTGSRIPRSADTETSQPVLTLDRQAIEATGLTSIGDVVQQISTNGAALNTTFNNGGNGTTQVSLRNLGSNRTLVLVNGRRWVTGLTGSVDLNTIPLAAVERVEVLKDGASAIYGSDAIAGVVNVITRQDFDGAAASALIGTTSDGDGTQQAYDFIIGADTERSNVLLGANYVKQESILAADREISAVPSFGLPPNNVNSGASSTSRFGRYDYASQGAGQLTLRDGAPGCRNNQACTPATVADFRRFSLATDGFNFAPENYLQTPQERIGVFGQARFDIADWVSFKTELVYNERRSEQLLAPQPLTFGRTLPRGFNSPTSLSYTFNISQFSLYNPFGEDITRVQKRMPTFAPRSFKQDVDTYRFAGSFDGSFEVGSRNFFWDAGFAYTDNTAINTTLGLQNLDRVRQAVGPSMIDPASGRPICVTTPGNAATVIQGCVPLNLLTNSENITPEMINYINYIDKSTNDDEQRSYTANIYGDLFELPGGMAGFAFGLEHRRVEGEFLPDALTSSGLTSGSQATSTRGGYNVDEAYLELALPLLADVPGAKLLEIELAARYSDYSTFGDTTNPKIGFKWKPIDDLLVRGNWSEGFRAPSIAELFTGAADSFPVLSDPCDAANLYAAFATGRLSQDGLNAVAANCLADGVPTTFSQDNPQIRTTVGGNPNLKPETSVSRTLGLVWSPSFLQGFNVSLDWWSIDIKDPIQAVNIQDAFDGCYKQLPGQRIQSLCDLITRDPVSGAAADIDSTLTNQGKLEVEGFDLNLTYGFETNFGKFSVNWDNSYISKFDRQITADLPVRSDVGNYTSNNPTWRLRSNITLGWERGDWDASLNGRWYSALDESCDVVVDAAFYLGQPEFESLCTNPTRPGVDFTGAPVEIAENTLGSRMYWDGQVGLALPWNGKVAIGINNLFDKDPPVAYETFANSFDPQYEIPGRLFYLRYNQKF